MEMNKPSNTSEMEEHLSHVDYPIKGRDFVAACNNMDHATKEEKDWVKQNMSMDKMYSSQDEVKDALKI